MKSIESYSFEVNLFTCIYIILIFAVFIILLLISKKIYQNNFEKNKNSLNYFPSLLTSLGVLGTFLGITLGLINFDPANIDNSIKDLLNGLKLAFLTSIVGMSFSCLLSLILNYLSDKKSLTNKEQQEKQNFIDLISKKIEKLDSISDNQTKGIELQQEIIECLKNEISLNSIEKQKILSMISDKLQLINQSQIQNEVSFQKIISNQTKEIEINQQLINKIENSANKEGNNLNSFTTTIESLTEKVDNIQNNLLQNNSINSDTKTLVDKLKLILTELSGNEKDIKTILEFESNQIKDKFEEFSNLLANNKNNDVNPIDTLATSVETISGKIDNIQNNLAQNNSINSDIKTLVDKLKLVLSDLDVNQKDIKTTIEIESNQIKSKFEEFSSLLAKNNTEALVNVMKKATEEFSSSMNSILERLVHENFSQLNNAVANMINWQKENKEQIQSLVEKYDKMNESFENTSTVLADITLNTHELVSDNSKFAKLIKQLDEVLIKENNFTAISRKLSDTVQKLENTSKLVQENSKQCLESIVNTNNNTTNSMLETVDNIKITIQKLNELYVGVIMKSNDDTKDIYDKCIDKIEYAVNTATQNLQNTNYHANRLFSSANELGNYITLLIKEIEGIKPTNEDFWKEVRERMEGSLNILKAASGELSKNLEGITEKLNDTFYQQLNSTLTNLDKCITTAMERNKK